MTPRVWLTLAALALAPRPALAAVEFNRDVRPILSEHCFACHGPDKAKRKANLRLDTAEGAKKALAAGRPAHSELFTRASAADKTRMPPASTGKALTAAQLATLKAWIEQGAKYEPHWAFIAPSRPALPAVKDTKWARNGIDRFLLARLEREGLRPAAEADRRTLIRRLSFDLTGLPPAAKDVEAFLADTSPRAVEGLVERLLASKHHGERLAQFWLDLVRYADTDGYHADNYRPVSLYRDWVIDAFNRNIPFDRFTIEQLAGDLLPGATREQRIASGYNKLLQTTEEGGAQAKEYLAKYAADRVRNAGSVWLGLTLGCAECHNHKFDPVSAREFYQFASFWADIREVGVGRPAPAKVPTPEQVVEQAKLRAAVATARQVLDTPTKKLEALQKLWEEEARAFVARRPVWVTLKPAKAVSAEKATLTVQDDHSVLASGENPVRDTYTVALKTDLKGITGLRLAALRHESLSNGGLSRSNGNFVLTGLKVSANGKAVKLAKAEADFSQQGFPVASLLKPRGAGWGVSGHIEKKDRVAVFTFAEPIAGGPGTTLVIRLEHNSIYPQHAIGRFRLDLTTAAAPGLGDSGGPPEAVVKLLAVAPGERTDDQKKALAAHYRSIAPALAATRRAIADGEARLAAMEASYPQALISESVAPRLMRVLPRGNWLDDSGEAVAPGVPAALPALTFEGQRATRLDLAKWLVAGDHPLVARVYVNRLWKLFFGQGLVTSLEDFGAQGAWPSHPELLDWLARELVESGWDTRHVVRLMVTSAAYRQSSAESQTSRARDPYNRLLGRQARFRLDAEFVRDNALAVSGLLVRRVGGASVKPYQPAGYWAYLNFPKREWSDDHGEGQYRRGLYTFVQRTFPHPSLMAFDAPSREECTVERPRSNTPQQALVLLNDPTYVEAARVLAERVVKEGGSDEARLAWAYRQVLGRAPRAAEAKVLQALVRKHQGEYAADAEAVDGLLSVGQRPVGKGADRAAVAAWFSVTRVLLNLHETITRE